MGIDALYGIDPVQGGADLRQIKQRIGDRVCLWGGMNSAVTLASGGRKEVETSVKEAIETLAPQGGFVLAPIDQLFEDTRWENVLTMIETWHRLSQTPA
jgi:uroporphyrinogen decarboxylase